MWSGSFLNPCWILLLYKSVVTVVAFKGLQIHHFPTIYPAWLDMFAFIWICFKFLMEKACSYRRLILFELLLCRQWLHQSVWLWISPTATKLYTHFNFPSNQLSLFTAKSFRPVIVILWTLNYFAWFVSFRVYLFLYIIEMYGCAILWLHNNGVDESKTKN